MTLWPQGESKAVSATVKPPNSDADSRRDVEIEAECPAEAGESNCRLSRATLGPPGTLIATEIPFWLLTVSTAARARR